MHNLEGTTFSSPSPRDSLGGMNRRDLATWVLCVLASLADGYDMQALGIAAMKYRAEFELSTTQLATIFASSSAGLFVGALAGGWFADRIGRRWVMIASMALFGIGSLVTAMLTSPVIFAEVRFLTGVGLGAAVANIIALVAEAGSPATRAVRVTVLTASNPLGGAIAAGIVALNPDIGWRPIFEIGGWWPLGVAVAMVFWLPESRQFEAKQAEHRHRPRGPAVSLTEALFGDGRTAATLALWVGFFFCVLAIHLTLNWLPSLLVSQGYSAQEAAMAACAFPFGGAVGTALLGVILGRCSRRWVMVGSFTGLVVSVAFLALAPHNLAIMLSSAGLSGFFVIGCQFLLYGLSPTFYPAKVRGTGVGTAVAAGRLGSITGPVMAGLLLGAGRPAEQVLLSILPGVMLALIAALVLTTRPICEED